MKASEVWWRLLIPAALIGFVGVDGFKGFTGKEATGTFSRLLAASLVAIGGALAALALIIGLIRFLKWAWKD
jgi:hypothetical protein